MKKSEKIKMIREIYSRLDVLNNFKFTPYRDDLFDQCLKSERQHRKGRPDSVGCGVSATDAAKYFTIKYIIETLITEKTYAIEDFISIRKECFYGQSIALNYKNEINEALRQFDINKFNREIDYSDLMEVK